MRRRQTAFFMALAMACGQIVPLVSAAEEVVIAETEIFDAEEEVFDKETEIFDSEEAFEEETGLAVAEDDFAAAETGNTETADSETELPAAEEIFLLAVEEVEDPGLAVFEGEEVYDYHFPFAEPGDNEMLFGDDRFIPKRIGCYVRNEQYPDGAEIEIPITGLEVTGQWQWNDELPGDENGEKWEAVTGEKMLADCLENEDGWNIHGSDYGKVELTLHYTPAKGDVREDSGTYKIDFFINGDRFDYWWNYPDGMDWMLFDSEMTVQGNLNHCWRYGDEGGCKEVTDFRLEIVTDEENNPCYDTEAITAALTEDEKGITVQSKDRDGGYQIPVIIRANIIFPDGREETIRLDRNLYVNISGDCYHVIEPQELMTEDGSRFNPAIGEAFDLSSFHPQVIRCEKDSETGDVMRIAEENIRFELEYDTNAWTETANDALPVLVRTGDWGTDVCLIARKNFAPEGEAEDWQEITRRNYWFDGLDYSAWFEELRGGDHTWVFEDEDLTVCLNTENADRQGAYTVEWKLGYHDEEDNWEYLPENCYTVKNENGTEKLVLHGAELTGVVPEEKRWLQLRAVIYAGETEVWSTETGVELRTPVYDYFFPDREPGDNEMLFEDDRFIPKRIGCYVENEQHPYGEEVEISITGLEVTGQWQWNDELPGDENGEKWEAVTGEKMLVDCFENEDGWNIHGSDYGKVELTLHYTPAKGDVREDSGTYKIDFFINGDRFDYWWNYPDGMDWMLLDSEMTVLGNLNHCWRYGDEGGCKEVADFRLEIVTDEENNPCYDTEALTAALTEDEKGITVQSKDRDGGYQIPVVIWANIIFPDGREETIRLDRNLYVNISGDCYHVIEPQELMTEDGSRFNPAIGEAFDLSSFHPQVIRCEKDPETGDVMRIAEENIRFELEYDTNAWTETANKEAGGAETGAADALPVLIRTGDWGTDVCLIARMNFAPEGEAEDWQEITRRNYWFDGLDYSAWFEDLRGGDHTWVFEDEELTVCLNTENADNRGEYTVEWHAGFRDEAGTWTENLPNNCYTVNADNSITLHGTKLAGVFSEDNRWFNLHAVMRAGEKTDGVNEEKSPIVWEGETGVELRTPVYELEDDAYRTLLPDESFLYNNTVHCWVENKQYPQGENLLLAIRNISSDDEQVMKCIREDGMWKIRAMSPGSANISYVTEHEVLGKMTFEREKEVAAVRYRLNIEMDSDCLLPGSQIMFRPVVRKERWTTGGVSIKEFDYSKGEYQIKYERDYSAPEESCVEPKLQADGSAVLTAGDTYGVTGIRIRVWIVQDGEQEVELEQYRNVWVAPYYYRIEADYEHPLCIEPGEALRVEDTGISVIRCDETHPDGILEKNAALYFSEMYDARISVSEDGRLLTVSDKTMTADSAPEDIWLSVNAEIPCGEESPYYVDGGVPVRLCVHVWKLTQEKKAGCTADGWAEYLCTKCGKTKKTEILKTGHKKVTDPAKAPACVTPGKTAGSHCSVCGTVLEAQKILPAAGHIYGTYVETKAPTALAEGEKTRTCTVCGHAEKASIPKLKGTMALSASALPLKTGQKTKKLTVTGMAKEDYAVSWTAENPKLVTVKGNPDGTCTITAAKKLSSKKKKSETTTITIVLASGVSQKVTVKVQTTPVKTTKISVPSKSLTLKRGKTTKLTPSVAPLTSLEKVTYKTSNKKVAAVSSAGVISAKSSGRAKITVKSGKKSVTVTVIVPKTRTAAIRNVKQELSLKKGKSYTLKPKLTPSKSEEKITYKSSNKKAAAVSLKGKITAKKKGIAVITVSSGKISVTCKVTVK